MSVCVSVAIGDSLSNCCRSSIMCSHSSIQTRQESTHLEAAISILDTMEGVVTGYS